MLKLGKNSGNGEIAPDIQPSLRVSTNLGLFKGRSPEEVKKIILAKYEHSDILTSDIPDGWSGEIRSNELSIEWTVDTGIIFISLFFISTLEISLSRVTEYQSTPRNALATLGRLQNLEPARRVEVRNLDPDEMDRQIEHYLSIINHQNTKRPPEICLTRA